MTRLFVGALFLFYGVTVQAQDAGIQAMQTMEATQAIQMQMTEQANTQTQVAMQNAQQVNEAAAQAASTTGCCGMAKPRFSQKAGTYPSALTLRMKDSSRGSAIYYTTDGWTPTALSTLYTGPITVSSTTTFQAIAVSPNQQSSSVASAKYVIPGSAPDTVSSSFPANAPGSPLIPPGARLPLVFTASVTSKGLQVGDTLPIALAQDLIVGGVVLAAKSTPVAATVTQVDDSHRNGVPGVLTFAVHSVALNNGLTLFLSGTRTKLGHSRFKAASGASFMLPLGGLFVRGDDADILSGTVLTAVVRSDTDFEAKTGAVSPAVQ